jgi:DnaJ-domain-containing protein 1
VQKTHFFGKLLGLACGAVVTGNPTGAILACLMGHFLFDYKNDIAKVQTNDFLEDPSGSSDALNCILKLCILQIKDVSLVNLNIIKDFFIEQFHFDLTEIMLIEKKFSYLTEKRDNIDKNYCCNIINMYCSQSEKEKVIRLLFILLNQELEVSITNVEKISETAEKLHLNKQDYINIQNDFFDTDYVYYKILGISPQASLGEVKRTYRKLMALHHPDHAGENYDKVRFQQITEAYNYLKKLAKYN